MEKQYATPAEWYSDAMNRRVTVNESKLKKRLELAEYIRQLGKEPTQDMIKDELLLITGRMDKQEFDQYISFKAINGGWQ